MRRVILAIVATAAALVLLLSFKTHPQSAAPGTLPARGAAAARPPAEQAGQRRRRREREYPGQRPGKTVTGAAWPTIYGPVQVRITVAGGRITAASAVEYPVNTPRDEQINAFAIPQLNSEAVAAGSAKIDTVSAPRTPPRGYIGSLQSALDKAGAS